jgi:uncharacterized protein YfaQ (DUF2300 family)
MKLKICGLTYEVFYKTPEEMQGNIGLARFNDQEIWIGNQFTEQTKKIALWHETLHLLSDAYNLKMDEEQVKFLTHALIALVEDNPEVFKNGQ